MLKYLEIKLDWGLRVPLVCLSVLAFDCLLVTSSCAQFSLSRLCHQGWHTLIRLIVLVLGCKRLWMTLSLPVNSTIFCKHPVTSWFRTQTINHCRVPVLVCGILKHDILIYMEIMHRQYFMLVLVPNYLRLDTKLFPSSI